MRIGSFLPSCLFPLRSTHLVEMLLPLRARTERWSCVKDNSLCTRPWRPATQTARDRAHVRHGHLQTSCAARLASDTTTSRVINSWVVKPPFSFSHVTTKRASCVVTLMAKGKLHTATSDAFGGPVRHCAHRTINIRSARGDVSITLTSVSSRITETARHTSAGGQGGSALPRITLFHKKLVMWSVRGYPASPPCHSTAQRVVRD